MVTAPDKRTLTAAIAIVIAALLACKKKDEEETPPVPSASAEPVAATPDAAAPEPKEEEGPELGDVTRYKDKEKEIEGVVKVLEKDVKVFNETDENSPNVATLNKDIFVNRLAQVGDDWVLVEFPSGVGELSPGWVEAKFLSDKEIGVTAEKVKEQQAAAVVTKKAVTEDKDAGAEKADEKADEKSDDKAKAETKDEKAKAETKDEKAKDEKTTTEKADNKLAAPKADDTKKKKKKKKKKADDTKK